MLTSAKENINVNEAIEMLLKEVNITYGLICFPTQDWSYLCTLHY